MSRILYVARVSSHDLVQNWHWSLELRPGPGSTETGTVYYDATNDGWGFKVRIRRSTIFSQAHNAEPGHFIGTIEADNVDTARRTMRTHPCGTERDWNCQDWVRSCVCELYQTGLIDKEAYHGFYHWNNDIVRGYSVVQ